VEAMACGKPLIACNLRSGVPCVCRDGLNGLIVPPADSAGLANAMRSLLDSAELRGKLGAEGRRLAQVEFSAPVMVERYRSLFQSLVGRSQG